MQGNPALASWRDACKAGHTSIHKQDCSIQRDPRNDHRVRTRLRHFPPLREAVGAVTNAEAHARFSAQNLCVGRLRVKNEERLGLQTGYWQ